MKRIVVIGNGMVGQRLLENLLAPGGDFQVTVLCEESRPAYDRVGLTSFFSGRSAQDLCVVPPDFFAQPGLELHLSEAATGIDRAARVVTTSSGRQVPYDRLVLATGSLPFVPPIPGCGREACFVYRTIDDLKPFATPAATRVAAS